MISGRSGNMIVRICDACLKEGQRVETKEPLLVKRLNPGPDSVKIWDLCDEHWQVVEGMAGTHRKSDAAKRGRS